MLLGIGSTVITMEPPLGHKDKEKDRKSASSSSSGSDGQVSAFDEIELHRRESPQLDTARLKQLGKIVISDEDIVNLEALEQALKQKGSKVEKEKRKSIIYMPQLDLAALARDLSGGSVQKGKTRGKLPDLEKGEASEGLDEQAIEQAFEFFAHYMKDKLENPDLDLKVIKSALIKKFKKAHNTPPPTPNDNPKIQKRQKTKQAVDALRKGSVYQATARTKRAQLPQSQALNRAREPRPLEILSSIINEPEVHECIQSVEQMVVNLLAQKNQQTQSSLTNTRYGGAIATLISAGASALITYLSTKKSC